MNLVLEIASADTNISRYLIGNNTNVLKTTHALDVTLGVFIGDVLTSATFCLPGGFLCL